MTPSLKRAPTTPIRSHRSTKRPVVIIPHRTDLPPRPITSHHSSRTTHSKPSSGGQHSDSEDSDSDLLLFPYRTLQQDQSVKGLDPIDKDPDFVCDDESSELDSDSDDLSSTETSPPAIVLPIVHSRFKRYFASLKCIGGPILNDVNDIKLNLWNGHQSIKWVEKIPHQITEMGEEMYKKIKIKSKFNYKIKLGQLVICQIQNHHFKIISKKNSKNILDYDFENFNEINEIKMGWFLIETLFERQGKKFFHGTRLEKSKKSFLGCKMSEPFELLLLEQCYEIELDAIVGVEKVEFLNSSTLPPIRSKKFFCRYRWSPNLGSLVSVEFPKPISEPKLPPHKASSLCRTCKAIPPDLEWLTDPKTGEILLGSDEKYSDLGIIVKGLETYKLWDYVRICRHGSPDKREDIGQIIEICGIRSKVLKEPVIDLTGEGFRPPENLQATLQHKLRQRQVAVTVRLYSRERWAGTQSEEGSNLEYYDNRRLWFTNETEVVNVLNGLAGHCKVIHFLQPGGGRVAGREKDQFTLDELRQHGNVFYTILPSQSEQELICSVPTFESHELPFISHPAAIKSLSSEGELTMKDSGAKKLRHLELFGGIGSMSVAFMDAGLTEQQSTCFVDWSIPACETVSKNFPKSTVICCDVHDLLSFMVDGKTCEGNDRLQDRRTQEWYGRDGLPKPGEVDLITAGFPCGSHSTLNVIRQGKDMKNALCATALSFVEYLRPDYVYFENVRGLVKSQLQDLTTQEKLKQAFLRLICGTLMSLNYQFNFGILQAAQYGTPQERRRIIFSAARRGLTVPKLPEPTHHFRDTKLTIKLSEHPKLAIDFRGHWGGGALKPVSVSDAIADLPCFEYVNPKLIMKDFSQKTRKVLKRRARLIPLLSGSYLKGRMMGMDHVGFPSFYYLSPPKNNFQLNLRVKRGLLNHHDDDHPRLMMMMNEDVEKVFNWHITGLWSDRILEMIWHIPLKANADHRSLPKPLQWKDMNSKVQIEKTTKKKKKNFTHHDFEGNFGRIGQSGQFKTLITKMDPRNQGKCGQVLHPTQHRTLTVLEAQRAQGFPDWFKLSSGDEGVAAMYKQIGNAIPIPICSALANSLWFAREMDWIKLGKPVNFNNLENDLLGLIDLYIDNLN